MGVPDEMDGLVRKRARLSLRTSNKPDPSKSTSGTTSIETTGGSNTGANQSYALVKTLDPPSECIDLPADLPSSPDPLVAPVASLHNLGNTCFLNSMLEVLRYTPGFLDGLYRLQDEILQEENKCEAQNPEIDISERRSSWQLVKNTCAMFTKMDKREEQYKEIATADASSMAVRPSALLENIRELNPMFEGNYQHDAQELLRCLLCYIEDAEKELTQLRDKEGATRESIEKISEAVLVTEEDKKIDVGVTEKCIQAQTFCSSLKGGEGQDRSKVTENEGQHALLKNVLKCERSTVSSAMVLCDLDDSRNGSSSVISYNVTCVKLESEDIETSSSGFSCCQSTKGRKRRRSKSKSAAGNKVTVTSENVGKTRTVRTRGLRRKTAGSDSHTCSDTPMAYKETPDVVAGSSGHRHIENLAVNCLSDNLCQQNLQTKATVSPNCVISPGSSTKASAEVKFEAQSASSRIVSLQPLNQSKKRLGTRGRAMISSICRSGGQLMQRDNNSNSAGDVNNNSDNCSSNNSSSAGAALNDSIDIDVLEVSHTNHQTLSPSCQSKTSPCKMVLKSPAKSPAMVELTDEISVISEGDRLSVKSPTNTVTKKYNSSISRISTSNSSQPAMTCSEPGLEAEPPGDVLPQHVLEPNKQINVTVQVSPRKKSSLLELNRKPVLCVPMDKASSERLALSSEDISKCPLSVADTYPCGVLSIQDGESGLWAWPHISDISAHEGRCQFAKTLQVSNSLTAPYTTGTSPGAKLANQMPCANTNPICDQQGKDILKSTDKSPQKSSLSPGAQNSPSQRSPGSKVLDHTSILQPKLELRKCDWLGVSPVKSVSAIEAMSILSQTGMGPESLTARRKILYDDADSSLSLSNSSDVNCLPVELSDDVSCIRDHVEVMDLKGSVPAEKDIKQRRSKVTSLTPARKSARTSCASKFRKRIPCCSSDKTLKACQTPVPTKDISLKSLSVTLDKCDWLLHTPPGVSVSITQALVDMRTGSKTISLQQKAQMANVLKQCQVQKTDLSDSGIRPQASPGTLVESLFGGTMMHQTKCLECEVARHRQEVFMDIGVPVRSLHNDDSDDDSDDDSSSNRNKSGNSCLSKLMQACTKVERLNESNKYFCEQCVHHVEAERSCHYLTLPSVLTLHLKRFSTNSKLFGHVSKLTDKVAIPQTLPCLHYQCKARCSNSSHLFSLFAIVTHSGSSILHGHYRAYVKVQPNVNPSVFHRLLKSKLKTEVSQLVGTKMDTWSDSGGFKDEATWATEESGFISTSDGLCDISRCHEEEDDDVYLCDQTLNFTTSTKSLANKTSHLRHDIDSVKAAELKSHLNKRQFDQGLLADPVKSESLPGGSSEYGSFWLECDDECIRVMEEQEFIDKLEEKDGCLIGTPYVLFYHKLLK